jgi:hypothetical protein
VLADRNVACTIIKSKRTLTAHGKMAVCLAMIWSELSPNFGDGRGRSGGGGYGLTVVRLGDDLDPVVECHTENEFWQLVCTENLNSDVVMVKPAEDRV